MNTFHALKYLYLDGNKFGRCLKKKLPQWSMFSAEVEVTHFYGIGWLNKSYYNYSLIYVFTVPSEQVEEGLSGWLELEATAGRRTERLAGLHRSMSLLKEAEVNPSHRLHRCSRICRKILKIQLLVTR